MKAIKYQGKYMAASEETISGHVYERIALRPGVQVLPVQGDRVLFIHEFRPHEKNSRWKLVSGWCDKDGKSPLDHAKEELAEETNLQAEIWHEYFDARAASATIDMNTRYFVCENVSRMEDQVENPDTGEVLDMKWLSQKEIFDYLHVGDMYPDQSVMIALQYLDQCARKKQS